MKKLSNYCNTLFQAEGMSLYRFCNIHNLERTSIRRLLNGERLPKEEQFNAFLEALSITTTEAETARQLYLREKIGPVNYDNRIYIKHMLEEIGEEHHFHFSRNLHQRHDLSLPDTDVTTRVHNFQEIEYLMGVIFSTAKKFLYSNITIDHPKLFQALQQSCYEKQPSVPFFHLLIMLKKSFLQNNSNYNLKLFTSIIPLSFQLSSDYHSLYTYGYPTSENDTILFPYYVLTSDHLLLISQDGKEAVLTMDSGMIRAYQKQCEKIRSYSRTLIMHSDDLIQSLQVHSVMSSTDILYTMDFFPCLFQIYSPELFIPRLKPAYQGNQTLFQVLEQSMQNVSQFSVYEAFLVYEGLVNFVKTGMLAESLSSILDPFTKEERRIILEKIKRTCIEDKYHLHILPEHYFLNTPQITIELYNNHQINLISTAEEHLLSRIRMSENSIYDSFIDYFEGLMQDPNILSTEESVHLIEELIDTHLV